MGDYSPVKFDDAFTLTASAAITGGTLVSASGAGTCAPSVAGDHSIGVAAHDAANGVPVTIWPLSGYTHEVPVLNAATVTAGGPVVAAAGGTINSAALGTAAAAGTLLGIAVSTATGNAGLTNKARFVGVA